MSLSSNCFLYAIRAAPCYVRVKHNFRMLQETEKGSWHIPLAGELSDESLRTWLCARRLGSHES